MEDNLLFSVSAPDSSGRSSVVEAAHGFDLFRAHANLSPLFPENRVGQAIPVMVEGEYFVKNPLGGKMVAVNFTPADLERIALEQPRDVPLNFDHQRKSGETKGWLRFSAPDGSRLAYTAKISTPTGEKLALFAVPEVTPETEGLLQRGVFRDTSVEYRLADGVLTGTAFTSYPVMREVQFYSEVAESPVDATSDAPAPADPPQEAQMNFSDLSVEDRATLLREGLATLGLDLATVQAQLAEAREVTTKSAAELRFSELAEGVSISPETRTAVMATLSAAADSATSAQFAELGGQPLAALEALFGELRNNQSARSALEAKFTALMGEVEASDGTVAELSPSEAAPDYDPSVVANLAALLK